MSVSAAPKRQLFLHALIDGIKEEMRRDERVFVMGEDVESPLFWGPTGTFREEFGASRVRNTPMSEAAFVGAGIGAAMTGMRPVVEMTVASFLYVAFDQVVSMGAKSRFMFGGQARIPMVIRATSMYGRGLAAQHSDRPYQAFMGVPGLKIVAPTTAADAKGLMQSAIRDDDLVLFFEDVNLHGVRGEVPAEESLVPIGTAEVRRPGSDVTVVGVSGGMLPALAAAEELASEGVSVEVVDPRTLAPLDTRTILESVASTGRRVVVDPAHRVCSVASEIAAIVAEQAFDSLRAPVARVTTPQVPIPFSPALERGLYPDKDKVATAVRAVLAHRRSS
jgi:acetoin:2,6-dichlorophenolindophenol oxidoreductase subunit beta